MTCTDILLLNDVVVDNLKQQSSNGRYERNHSFERVLLEA